MKAKWKPDDEAMAMIKREYGLKVEYREIQISDIDRGAGLRNHARLIKPIDENVVQEYAISMERGDVFRAGVYRSVGKKYVAMGGNHRLDAAELFGETSIMAHIIETDDIRTIDVLPRLLNSLNGVRLNRDDLLTQALHVSRTHGMPLVDVAKQFGIPVGTLRQRELTQGVSSRLSKLGISPTGPLASEAILKKLNLLKTNTNVMGATASLIKEAGLGVNESVALVESVLEETNELGMMESIKKAKQRIGNGDASTATASRAVVKKSTKYKMAITRMEKMSASSLLQNGISEKSDVERITTSLKVIQRNIAVQIVWAEKQFGKTGGLRSRRAGN